MFLPVLLVRDFGWPGFVVFAIPNVLGAAAMGFVLRDRRASQRFVQQNSGATFAFSLVTIAFHIFVGLWLLPRLIGAFFPVLILAILFFLFRRDLLASVFVYLISLGLFAYLLVAKPLGGLPATHNPMDLMPLALVCLFGFFFCPYLDLTFHHAYQQSPNPKFSFAFGFGIVFFSMILFTLAYSQNLFTTARTIVGIHMTIQIALTVAFHYRRIEPLLIAGKYVPSVFPAIVLPAIAGVIAGYTPWGEDIYRFFMGFYGLVFPSYLFFKIAGRSTRLWIVLCVLATPFFFVGFILGQMIWVIPGLALVILPPVVLKQSVSR